ncbi:MBL fold metallo-hydrolase [Subtercola sp. YIM 133946]|uniref:MBL fold metallo-hydrolase n=1 Tax=Subtercola sp. YIM 133946 TaxID=3118909 RepID=UPI002F92D493
MRVTSSSQFDATAEGSVPPFEQVRPHIWALPLAMPTPALPYVLSYFVIDENGLVHVIDAGWDSDENWQRVLAALAELGLDTASVASLTLTHLHPDHVGMTHRYRAASRVRVQLGRVEQAAITALTAAPGSATAPTSVGSGPDARRRPAVPAEWGVPADRVAELGSGFGSGGSGDAIEGDVLLDDGDDLGVPGVGIRVITTPGHTNGSICLAFEGENLLVTGDHLLPTIFSGLGLGGPTDTNPVSDYLAALERLAPFDDPEEQVEVLPGHGYRFTGVAERRAESAEHHQGRTRQAAAILAENPDATVWQVASQLYWTSGWENLNGPYLRSALAQTAWHRERAAAGLGGAGARGERAAFGEPGAGVR